MHTSATDIETTRMTAQSRPEFGRMPVTSMRPHHRLWDDLGPAIASRNAIAGVPSKYTRRRRAQRAGHYVRYMA